MTRPPQTRERLLAAAEQLFLERGFAATSTRDITEAAGANLAAVNYHFRSKEELMIAVTERTVRPVLDRQIAGLEQLQARPEPPTVEEVVAAYIRPFVEHRQSAEGRQIASFVSRAVADGTVWVRRVVDPVEDRFRAELARILPELSPEEVDWRFLSMMGVFIVYGLGLLTGEHPDVETEEIIARLTAFCAAGIQATPAI